MSLHEMFCNKPKPCYKCTESIKLINGDSFHIGIEYQIEYVEKRMNIFPNKKIMIEKHFKLLT
jgi:hypothetical protein